LIYIYIKMVIIFLAPLKEINDIRANLSVHKDFNEELSQMTIQLWVLFRSKISLFEDFITKWKELLPTYAKKYICLYICVFVCLYIYMFACLCVCVCVCRCWYILWYFYFDLFFCVCIWTLLLYLYLFILLIYYLYLLYLFILKCYCSCFFDKAM
jgi:hypothetical protein